MKTQQQAQIIFDNLVTNLESANWYGLRYVTRNIRGCDSNMQNPLEYFLTSMQEMLVPEDFDRQFLSQVYAAAFHTGDIPNNRNHIAMTCNLTVNSQPTSPLLRFWIDLDKVAVMTNAHFDIKPPCRFNVEYGATNSSGSEARLTQQTSSAVNSIYNSSRRNAYFLTGCILSGIISGYALLIAALAIASILTLSTAGICTAVGISVLAGVASYGLFQSRSITTSAVCNESNPEDIIDIFQQHFAATIDTAPQDRVEVIGKTALGI